MTGYIPVPPEPWVPTATDSVTKRLPDATMEAIAESQEITDAIAAHGGGGGGGGIPPTIVNAKGDLIGASGDDTPVRVAVGTNGQQLVADSTQTAGVRWITPSIAAVIVTTGTETRPAANVVIWVDPDEEGATNALSTDPIISGGDISGLPDGGSTGQVLTKASSADGDVSWQDVAGGGGGGTPVVPINLLLSSSSQYRMPGYEDGGGSDEREADKIGILILPTPWRVKVKSIIVWRTDAASSTTLCELGLYDGESGARVASFGTFDMASTGNAQLTLGTSVEVPSLAVWACKLRAASSNGGKLRNARPLSDAAALHSVGNTWDGIDGGTRGLAIPHSGTGALPSTLPAAVEGGRSMPLFSVVLEAV